MNEIDVTKCQYYDAKDCLCEYETYNWEIEKFYQCKNNPNCYYKQLQQLKAENEKLKQDLQKESDLGHKAMCDEADMAWEVHKLQKCLDEIEEVIKFEDCCNCPSLNPCSFSEKNCNDFKIETISEIIKQAKEGK